MIRKLLVLLLLFPFFVLAQNERVKVLNAIVVTDSMQVERATIINRTAETMVVTDDLGQFSIFAKAGDVLVISGVAFETKEVVLKEENFNTFLFKIQINIKVNQLDEVKIAAYKLTGNLAYDAKRIKVKAPFKVALPKIDWSKVEITGVKSRVENPFMPTFGISEYNMNFLKIGSMVASAFKSDSGSKKKKIEEQLTFEKFEIEIKNRFSDTFFKEKLNIDKETQTNFISYCFTNEIKEKLLLEQQNSLLLIEYLITKSDDYHKKK